MATVQLYWQKFYTTGDGAIHRCEVKARKEGDALVMEVYDRGGAVLSQFNVSAYYRFEDSQRRIPLYDDEGFGGVAGAQEALA